MFEAMQDNGVAHLVFKRAQSPRLASKARTIRPNDCFDIGRADFEKIFRVREPTISAHHLRFRCIVYEDGSPPAVSPMVYVRILSTNAVRIFRSDAGSTSYEVVVREFGHDVLLTDGDVLQLTANISILFREAGLLNPADSGLDNIQLAEIQGLGDQFAVSKRRLGFGGQASVFLATEQSSGRQVACKITPWPETVADATIRLECDPHLTKRDRERELESIERRATQLQREFHILQDIAHPNIINLEKVVCTPRNVYIFEELITGGDLLSFLDQKAVLPEPQAAVIILQLLKAVEYLHDRGIVHRDIKPENILMTSWRAGARVVLTDFGHARLLASTNTAVKDGTARRMHTTVGTRGYMAPEMFPLSNSDELLQGYSKAIDVWSIGCITAMLLTGESIFPDNERTESQVHPHWNEKPMTWDLSIIDSGRSWAAIGRKARSFVRGCLNRDETKRLTADQALKHQWFSNKHYAAEMQAAYIRLIEGWKPGIKSIPFIEFNDVSVKASTPLPVNYTEQLAAQVTSPFFNRLSALMPAIASFRSASRIPPYPIRKSTPLPSLSEEMGPHSNVDQAPTSAAELQSQSMWASQHVRSDHFSDAAATNLTGRFSIEDFAPPPTTQVRALQEPPVVGTEQVDSQVESQSVRGPRLPHLTRPKQRQCDVSSSKVGVNRYAAASRMTLHSWQTHKTLKHL